MAASLAGVFYRSSGGNHKFASIALSFIPRSYQIVASSNGLIACRNADPSAHLCSYFVLYTADGSNTYPISDPPTPLHPDDDSPVALVYENSARNLDRHFHIVCPINITDEASMDDYEDYSIQTYFSEFYQWSVGEIELRPYERIIPGSAISCGGKAYWRTEFPSLFGFEPVSGQPYQINPPNGVEAAGVSWALGEADGHLCSVVVENDMLKVYFLQADHETWMIHREFEVVVRDDAEGWNGIPPIVCRQPPRPLRFTGATLMAMLWVDYNLVVFDVDHGRGTGIPLDGPAPHPDDVDYVPHVN